jgi:hypothetical protein
MSWYRTNWYRSMLAKLRKAASLSAGDWWILLRAWGLLILADLALRVLSFARVQALFGSGRGVCRESTCAVRNQAEAERVAYLVRVAARYHIWPTRCLHRALVGQWLLRRQGIDVDLRIGVRREGQILEAHAWLEYQGEALGLDGDRQGFAPLDRIPELVQIAR